jgi:hypothetical protein
VPLEDRNADGQSRIFRLSVKISGPSKAFHEAMKVKIPSVASAGTESGRIECFRFIMDT